MASFEERSNSSKIDSSDAETNENSAEKSLLCPLNGENNNLSVNIGRSKMADKLITTPSNQINSNCAQIQSIDARNSDTSFVQPIQPNANNTSNGDVQPIVCSAKQISESTEKPKCVVAVIGGASDPFEASISITQKPLTSEKNANNEKSHVVAAAIASSDCEIKCSNQNKKIHEAESKHHPYIKESQPTKSKTTENGTGIYFFFV